MDKQEIIFFAIVIIAYLMCTLTLDIPMFVHIMFAILILVALAIGILLKYKPQLENEKIGRFFYILTIILLILYIISTISELWYGKTLIIDSGIFLFSFLIMLVISWFFKKNSY